MKTLVDCRKWLLMVAEHFRSSNFAFPQVLHLGLELGLVLGLALGLGSRV